MKLLPLLALLAIGSPALANDVVNFKTNNGFNVEFRRENVWCKKNIYSGYDCTANGVATDLMGQRTHYSVTEFACYTRKGDGTVSAHQHPDVRNKIACQAAYSFGN